MSEPYYTDDLVTLYHGDCADVLPGLAGVDLVFTSPPYNLGTSPGAGGFGHYRDGKPSGSARKWAGSTGGGIDYHDHTDAMPYRAYENWQRKILRLTWRTLSDHGAIFYNHKPRVQSDTLWLPLTLNPGLPVRQIITWARSGGTGFSEAAYMSTSEWIIVFAKPAWRLRDRAASGLGDVWRISQEANPDHPAPFPISLPAAAIESTTPRLVLDPLAGSGTTLRAAKDAGVRSIGVEIDERYCEIAARRLAQDTLFGEVTA
jgi:site-specific DNA-methyltransferase (adenine-specific)